MNHNRDMPARLSAFVIWTLVAFATMFWGLRLLAHPAPPPANAVAASEMGSVRGDLSRLLGAEPVTAAAPAPQAASRFKLLGVMAQKSATGGATPGFALISVDGKPARAFAAGASIDDQWVLQSVSLRSASLGPANSTPALVLEVPPLPMPATGSLPPAAVSEQFTTVSPSSAAPVPSRSVFPGRPRELSQEQAPPTGPNSGMPPEAVR